MANSRSILRSKGTLPRQGATAYLANSNAVFPRSHPSFSTALIGPGTRLFCRARARFRPHLRTVAGGQPVPKVGLLAPTLSRRFKVSGSQRVLLLDAVAGADAGHKRRPENRLMMRGRDPVRVAPAWSKSILPQRFRATRQYQGLDLTGARIGHAILASPFL